MDSRERGMIVRWCPVVGRLAVVSLLFISVKYVDSTSIILLEQTVNDYNLSYFKYRSLFRSFSQCIGWVLGAVLAGFGRWKCLLMCNIMFLNVAIISLPTVVPMLIVVDLALPILEKMHFMLALIYGKELVPSKPIHGILGILAFFGFGQLLLFGLMELTIYVIRPSFNYEYRLVVAIVCCGLGLGILQLILLLCLYRHDTPLYLLEMGRIPEAQLVTQHYFILPDGEYTPYSGADNTPRASMRTQVSWRELCIKSYILPTITCGLLVFFQTLSDPRIFRVNFWYTPYTTAVVIIVLLIIVKLIVVFAPLLPLLMDNWNSRRILLLAFATVLGSLFNIGVVLFWAFRFDDYLITPYLYITFTAIVLYCASVLPLSYASYFPYLPDKALAIVAVFCSAASILYQFIYVFALQELDYEMHVLRVIQMNFLLSCIASVGIICISAYLMKTQPEEPQRPLPPNNP